MIKILWLIAFLFVFSLSANATTTTIYSTTADGRVFHSGPTYTTVRGATDGTTANSSESNAGADWNSGSTFVESAYYIRRCFFYFDTSSIPDTDVISSVVLHIYTTSWGYSGTYSVCAQQGTQAATLTTADYDSFTGNSWGEASWDTTSSGYKTITLNATGIAGIVKDGTTKICLRAYSKDYTSSAPTNTVQNANVSFSDSTGTTYDPKIVITHVSPVISGTLKEKESDASGSAMEYLVLNRSTGAVVGKGTAAADGTYSVEGANTTADNDIFMLDPLDVYAPKTIGELVMGVTP